MPEHDGSGTTILIADRIIDGLGGDADEGSALVLEDGLIRGSSRKRRSETGARGPFSNTLEHPSFPA